MNSSDEARNSYGILKTAQKNILLQKSDIYTCIRGICITTGFTTQS